MEYRERAAREAASVLAQALSEAHALLARAAEEESAGGRRRREQAAGLRDEPPLPESQPDIRALADYFTRAIDTIGVERRLLADQVSSLAQVVQRLEERLAELERLTGEAPPAPTPEAPPGERGAVAEGAKEAFAVGGEGVQLVVSAVPGFQELMELQRALMRLKAVERASVERYFEGEARVVLLLREPLTAGDVVDAIREASGHQLAVEEARPSALSLRLRFLEG